VLPLLAAALLAAGHRLVPRWLAVLLAVGASLAVACVAVSMLVYSRDAGLVVYWFGGWIPHAGHAPGIAFAIDNSAAMLVLLASVLAAAAMSFGFRNPESGGTLFYVLMLVFLAAASGIALTGDLFNLFLFVVLLSASLFVLCAASPGGFELAVAHTVGLVLLLGGIALVYQRTAALNMAEAGRILAGRSDPVAVAAFALAACGLLVETAIVPFHLWLAGALQEAPAPVGGLTVGIVIELGLYAITRLYWVVFSGALNPYENGVRNLLVTFGAITALVGAATCFAESHLKRMIGFSAIAHAGIMLMGVALWSPSALAGVNLYAMAQAMLHAALFLGAGILLHRMGTVDEFELHGRARRPRWLAILFFLGAAGLAGLPPFTSFWGDVMLNGAAIRLGYSWIPWLVFFAQAGTASAIFRFSGRAFLGWGAAPVLSRPHSKGHGHAPFSMYASASALLLLGLLAGLAPGLTGAAESAALYMQDRAGYAQRVLDMLTPYPPSVHDVSATAADLTFALAGVTMALWFAWAAVSHLHIRRAVTRWRGFDHAMRFLRMVHHPNVVVSVVWLILGTALFGVAACCWIL